MRLSLGGQSDILEPLVLTFRANAVFAPAQYITDGYTYADILCVGAAGGHGGGFRSNLGEPYGDWVAGGGGGGGGGAHLIHTLLSVLPVSSDIIVGEKGDHGFSTLTNDPDGAQYGQDGGPSSFGGVVPICRASGGKGGKPVLYTSPTWSKTDPTGADGGEGGIGNAPIPINAGGGAAGGVAATVPLPTATAGSDGSWDGAIGKGGGGGAGGVYEILNDDLFHLGTDGGRGSYNFGNTLFYGKRGPATNDHEILPMDLPHAIYAGEGGGAKTTGLDFLFTTYGSRAPGCVPDGAVIIRLTRV